MGKKIFLYAIAIAFIVTLVVNSVAYAAKVTPEVDNAVYDNRYGKVTAVFTDHFHLRNLSGVVKNILYTTSTKVYNVKGEAKTMADVKVGVWLFAAGIKPTRNTFLAKNIVLTGSTYITSKYWGGKREWGTVVSTNPAYGVIFMNTSKSGLVKVIAYTPTVFLNPQVNSVSKITVGMKVLVAGTVASNGFILARIVDAFWPAQ